RFRIASGADCRPTQSPAARLTPNLTQSIFAAALAQQIAAKNRLLAGLTTRPSDKPSIFQNLVRDIATIQHLLPCCTTPQQRTQHEIDGRPRKSARLLTGRSLQNRQRSEE